MSVIVGLSCAKAQATVDWRYTRWGMTEEQVVAASHGTARPAGPEDQSAERSRDAEVKLKAPVSWIEQSFVAFFGFDRQSHRLSSITLELQNGTKEGVAKLQDALNSLYGSPTSSVKQKDVELVVWFAGSEQIGLVRLSNPVTAVGAPVTSVSYQPLGDRR